MRVARRWAGTFEELLLDTPRTDAPRHLPTAPEPAAPWDPPPPERTARDISGNEIDFDDDGDGDERRARRARSLGAATEGGATAAPAARIAQHCSSVHGGAETPCRGHEVTNRKQRRLTRLLSGLLRVAEPEVDGMSFSQTDQWIARHWRRWMERKDEL